jgi:RHS repeat-associated protein
MKLPIHHVHRFLLLTFIITLIAPIFPHAVLAAPLPPPTAAPMPAAVLPVYGDEAIPAPANARSQGIPADQAKTLGSAVEGTHDDSAFNGDFSANGAGEVQQLYAEVTTIDLPNSPPGTIGTIVVTKAITLPGGIYDRLIIDAQSLIRNNYGATSSVIIRPRGSSDTTAFELTTKLNPIRQNVAITLGNKVPRAQEVEIVFQCYGDRKSPSSCQFSNLRFVTDVPRWQMSYLGSNSFQMPTQGAFASVQSGTYKGIPAIAGPFLALDKVNTTNSAAYYAFTSDPVTFPQLPAAPASLDLSLRFRVARTVLSATPAAGLPLSLIAVDNSHGASLGNILPGGATDVPWMTGVLPIDSSIASYIRTHLSGKAVYFRLDFGGTGGPHTIALDSIELWSGNAPLSFAQADPDLTVGKGGCPKQCTGTNNIVGDPVNTFSGAFFLAATDAALPRSGPELALERTYVSRFTNPGYPVSSLGPGWRQRFAPSLTFSSTTTLIYEAPTGNRLRFTRATSTSPYLPTPGVRMQVRQEGSDYVFTTRSQAMERFDGQGRIVQETDPQGHALTYTYYTGSGQAWDGQLQQVTDSSSGRTLTFGYGVFGGQVRLQTVQIAGVTLVTYGYDNSGRLTAATDSYGGTTTYGYQGTSHLLTTVTPPLSSQPQVTNTYTNGRVTQQVESSGVTTTYDYTPSSDGPATRITRTHADGSTEVLVDQYRADGTLRWQTRNGQFERYLTFDSSLSPNAIIDANGQTTKITSTAAGLPTRVVAPTGDSATITYDTRQRPTSVTDARGVRTDLVYNDANNLIRQTVGITTGLPGYTTSFTYTADQRLQEQRGPDGLVTRYDYTTLGQVLTQTVGLGTAEPQITTYGYDELGYLRSTTVGVGTPFQRTDLTIMRPSGVLSQTIQNYQDGQFNPLYPDADVTTTYGYDQHGRLIWTKDVTGRYDATQYDAQGRVIWTAQNLTNFNGTSNLPVTPPAYTPTTPDANVATFYGYDGFGRTTEIRQTGILTGTFDPALRRLSTAIDRVTRIEYDALSRPITTTLNYRPGVPPGPDVNVQSLTYYDGNGNPIWTRDGRGRWTKTDYDALNRPFLVISNYENGAPQTLCGIPGHPACADGRDNRTWATITDTDQIQFTAYRDDGQIDYTVDSFFDGAFDPAFPDQDRITRYGYDALGRLTTTTLNDHPASLVDDPATPAVNEYRSDTNHTTTTAYDPVTGRVLGQQDALGRWTSYRYDDLSRTETVIANCVAGQGQTAPTDCAPFTANASDQNVPRTTAYTVLNWVLTTTNVANQVQYQGYDQLGRVRQTTANYRPGQPAAADVNVTTRSIADGLGRVTTQWDAAHQPTTYTYDGLGRVATITDPANRVQHMGYDGTGAQRWREGADGRFTVLQVDGLGRVVATIANYQDGVVSAQEPTDSDLTMRTVYDRAGRRVATIDARNRTTRFAYDLFDRLVQVTENATSGTCAEPPCTVVTRYTYDRVGNRTAITDANGHTRTFVYDAADRLVQSIDAEGISTGMVYDKGNRLRQELDPRGAAYSRTHDYNAFDQVIATIALSLTVPITQTYDALGRRTALRDETGTTTFEYDDLGRMTAARAPGGRDVTYTYTARGERASLSYPGVTTPISYTYTTDGQLDNVLLGSTVLADYGYDSIGRLQQVQRDNGALTTYGYDAVNRLTSLETATNGVVQSRFTYLLDRLGLRTQATEAFPAVGVGQAAPFAAPAQAEAMVAAPEAATALDGVAGAPAAVPDYAALLAAPWNDPAFTAQDVGPLAPDVVTSDPPTDESSNGAAVESQDGAAAAPMTEDMASASMTAASTIAIRLNAGGQATTINGVPWLACSSSSNCSGYALNGASYSTGNTITLAGNSAPADATIYQTGRQTDSNNGRTSLNFAFAVPNGGYTVRLHFAETQVTAANQRRFAIQTEGVIQRDQYDIFAVAGARNRAVVEELSVTVTDGVLNLDFLNQLDNARVSGIEVLGQAETPPASTPLRINSGGTALTVDGVAWTADQYFVDGRNATAISGVDIVNTTSDAIYYTARSSDTATVSYAIPLTSGTYTVKLHFAEIYFTGQPGKGSAGSGRRVVDVNLDGGNLELDNYDINAAVGPLAADVQDFMVDLTDGVLDIVLVASVDKPLLNALEVLREPDPPSGLNTRTITYTYDGLLRLTDAVYSTGATYGYGYDLAGNRTRVTANGSTTTYAFDAANQVVGWQYDASGNLTNDGANSYTYDTLGRLARQNQTTYRYNGDGVLSSVTANNTTLAYTQDLAAPLSQVLMVGAEVVIYGRERLFTAHPQGLNWQVHDGLGSLRQILDGSGTATNRADYDPWGQPQGSASSSFGFTGEVQADNGLTYLRARWYHPGQGNLLGRDPFEGFADQPYSQQYYQYAYSNPVNWTDPSGKYSSSPIEAMIQIHYETRYTKGIFQAEYPIYLSSKQHLDVDPWTGRLEGDVPDNLDIGRIDIADMYKDVGYVYEIKNARDQERGSLEIERYINIYASLPSPQSPRHTPTPPRRLVEGVNFPSNEWQQIGPNPFFGGATIIARLGEPGVIVWKSANNRFPIPVAVDVKEKVNYRQRRSTNVLRPQPTFANGICIPLLPGFLLPDPFGGYEGSPFEDEWEDPITPDSRDDLVG